MVEDIENVLAERIQYINVDDMWTTVGVFGRYQLMQIILLLLHVLTSPTHALSYYFIGYEPEHQYILPKNITELSRYGLNISMTVVVAEKCTLDAYDDNNHTAEAISLPCVYGNNYSLPTDVSITSEWDLVCEKFAIAQLPETAVLTGQMVGSLFSFTADNYGRKNTQIVSQVAVLLSTLPMPFLNNFWFLCATRLVTGFFMQLVQVSAMVPFIELVPTNKRPFLCMLHEFAVSVSLLFFAFVAFLLKGFSWRILAFGTTLTTLPFILDIFMMDESVRWLKTKKQSNDAARLLMKICKTNNVPIQTLLLAATRCKTISKTKNSPINESSHLLPLNRDGNAPDTKTEEILNAIRKCDAASDMTESDKFPPESEDYENQTKRASYLKELRSAFKEPRLILQFCVAWSMWFVDMFVMLSLFLLPHMFNSDRFVNFVMNECSSLIGSPLSWMLMTRYSRKRCGVICHCVSGIGLMMSTLVPKINDSSTILSVIGLMSGLTGRISASMCFSFLTLYTPEIFPTNLRNTGVGIAFFFGHIGGVCATFAILLTEFYVWLPGVVLASCCLIMCFAITFLPETSGTELPQSIAEIKERQKMT